MKFIITVRYPGGSGSVEEYTLEELRQCLETMSTNAEDIAIHEEWTIRRES